MSDDILHTGRADIHHPKGPLTAEPAAQQPLSPGDPLRAEITAALRSVPTGRWHIVAMVDALAPVIAAVVARVRAAALRDFAASMRALAEQAPEGEPAAWPWSAYALAAMKAEEHAGKGFPSDDTDQTPDVGTPDPQRYWWQHDDCDSGPVAGAADWPGRPCTGCGMSLGGWTRGAPIAAGSVPSLPEETPDA